MPPKTDRGRAAARLPREELPPAPGELRLVQAFVNTADLLTGHDQLATPRALADWLAQRGLLPVGTELSAADLERMKGVRENLRSLIAAGAAAEQELVEAFDDAAAEAGLRPRWVPGEGIRFEPSVPGVAGALARLAAIHQLVTWRCSVRTPAAGLGNRTPAKSNTAAVSARRRCQVMSPAAGAMT